MRENGSTWFDTAGGRVQNKIMRSRLLLRPLMKKVEGRNISTNKIILHVVGYAMQQFRFMLQIGAPATQTYEGRSTKEVVRMTEAQRKTHKGHSTKAERRSTKKRPTRPMRMTRTTRTETGTIFFFVSCVQTVSKKFIRKISQETINNLWKVEEKSRRFYPQKSKKNEI